MYLRISLTVRILCPVEATDCGREGEAIFRLVYEMAGCTKPFKRLWISSMEADAIREGFNNLKPGIEYDNLYNSAKCRQEADWLVGINGTRLFSTLYGKTLKVGRVQTPTLSMLVNRDTEIRSFKKEPYYTVHIGKNCIDALSNPIKDKSEADKLSLKCLGKDAKVISVKEEEKTITAPALYDLTSLQRDANRIFGYIAKQTLDYTQALYEKKLVTYPRTDSRYLSDDMGETARKVLYLVRKEYPFIGEGKDVDDYRKILNSKKITDHHAIIPTMEIASADLNSVPVTEKNILSLVAARLVCAVAETHRYKATKAVLSCEYEAFYLKGKTVIKKGWKEIEENFRKALGIEVKEKENALPILVEGQVLTEVESKAVENFTKPPKSYTEDTLLSSMERAGSDEMADDVERKGLGTPATRADIIEKLVSDGFVSREKKEDFSIDGLQKIVGEDIGLDILNEIQEVYKEEIPEITDFGPKRVIEPEKEEKPEDPQKSAEYKPLAKVEELEEQNYNLIDNVLNNTKPKKAERPEDRPSLREKLRSGKKKMEAEKRERNLQDPRHKTEKVI